MLFSQAKVTAVGSYVPGRRLTNDDLSKSVETNDEWIQRRTGMKERRIAEDVQFTSDLAIKAVESMIETFSLEIQTIDMIIVATSTSDFVFPSVASQIQNYFGISQCGSMDLSAACAGFTYALNVANGLVSTNQCKKALVVGAETMSKVVDYQDRTTCVLFGDGAGVALVEREEINPSFVHASYGTRGDAGRYLYVSNIANNIEGEGIKKEKKIVQNGREVFKLAVSSLSNTIPPFLKEADYGVGDVDWFVPHSANMRIIHAICDRINMNEDKVLFSGEYYGNTSSASIPLSLTEAYQLGKLQRGDLILLSGFGGGFVYSHCLLRWSI
ncbi:ketoacyl-ACP synthase III [Shimazuella kribbensis]|uniref:ketoacyl-ACP synthase III n=1 Tax=Shimazuella kribbensis TaxID=139808 RepID=UPI00041E8CCC|nr:ketoacyl-ACP synthase III [Shimazuella kribbensis]